MRTMAKVVQVAATRLVWRRREYISVAYHEGVHSQKTGGSEGAVAAYFTTTVPLKRQTSANEHQWPKHNLRSAPEETGRTTTTACLYSTHVRRTRCVYPPALLSDVAVIQVAVVLASFSKVEPRIFDLMLSALLRFRQKIQIMPAIVISQPGLFLNQKAQGSSRFSDNVFGEYFPVVPG